MSKAVTTNKVHGGISLEWVPVSQMAIDPKYQRDVKRSRVLQIAKRWDQRAAGAVAVTRHGQTYFIIDGQHRWEAAKVANVDSLASIVYEGLSTSEQAKLFVFFNRNQLSAHIVDVFRADLAQGNPEARDIDVIIKGAGMSIGVNEGGFQAIGTAKVIYERFGGDVLAAILNVMYRAWPNDPRGRGSANIIRALAAIYSHYSASCIDWEVMEKTLHRTTADDILRAAGARRIAAHSHVPALAAQVISELYNDQFGKARQGRFNLPSTATVFAKAMRSYAHDDIVNSAGLRVVRV